ncbi:MAG: dephospho-CoA kinase [Clostridiales bacterium]|nr:dephospho-CoA kinase [Clostridiales bacterium]
MFVLGITGAIGTGKSTVSGILAEKGLRVLDADEISRMVTGEDGRAIPEIAEVFGKRALSSDGSLNRKYVSSIVFTDNKLLDILSSIIHKYVFEYMDEELQKEREKKTKCVVLDVPIPVTKGFVDHCNQIWAVTCDDSIRLERLVRRGLEREDAKRRMAVQMTNDEYAALADIEIDNSGSPEELNEKVEKLIKEQLHERGIRI